MSDIRAWFGCTAIMLCVGCGLDGAEPPAADATQIAAAVGAATVPPTSGDWPAFRGEHRNGISTESGWKSMWPAEGPRRLWTAEAGLGYSSLSIGQGRAYTLGNVDGQESVFCWDAADGREIWRHTYAAALIDNLHRGGPGASPTIDGERVFTVGKEGYLFCFNAATGAVNWSMHLAKDLNVATPEWGFTSSPLVVGDMIVLDVAGPMAFNKTTGQLLWRSETQRAGYGSPVLFQPTPSESLIATLTNDSLLVVRADDGTTVATYPWTSDYSTTGTTPVIGGRTLFISSGYGTGCALLEYSEAGLTPLFRNKEMSNHMCSSILWRGHYFGIDGNSHNARQCKLVCLDAATGKRVWEQRGFGCGALMLADGKLLIQSDDGNLTVAEASATGYEELARTKAFDGHTWTMPVLAQGRVYCRSESGTVVCFDVR